jgi:hypothetical protein
MPYFSSWQALALDLAFFAGLTAILGKLGVVLVNWNNPKLADVYLKDWKHHWDHSDAVAARY